MYILLFIGYSLLCIYGIIKIPFVRRSEIRPAFLVLFFALHVAAGLVHNIIAYRYYPGHGDIWNFYQWSFIYRHRLFSDFSLFLENNASLTYFTHNGIIGIQMFLNIFSFNSLTINTLLFSFPVFLGNIALFRLFRRRLPRAPLAAFTVFLLPSTLFWTSCIHREGVLYMLLGFLLYSFDRLLARQPDQPIHIRPRRTHILIFFMSFILLLYFRFSIALSLLPALGAWWLAERSFPRRRLLIFTGVGLSLLIILILTLPGFFHSLATGITFRQKEFSGLEGHSRLPLPEMDGTWRSIGSVLPAAVRNGGFEPLPGNGGQKIYLFFSLELLLIWAIIAITLVRSLTSRASAGLRPSSLLARSLRSARKRSAREPSQAATAHPSSSNPPVRPIASDLPAHPSSSNPPVRPFVTFCLLFSLSGLLLIGAIVPFAGAIVRYRSIFLPFLLAPALYGIRTTPFCSKINTWITRRLTTSGENTLSH